MSRWTHIRGGLELYSTPYEMKKSKLVEPKIEDFETEEDCEKAYDKYVTARRKLYYLPYPEEQFKLRAPKPSVAYGKKKKDGTRDKFPTLDFEAEVYSLPRARKYIEEAFNLMPQGEGEFRYSIDQKSSDSTSSSGGFWLPCQYKAYKNALNKMYKSDNCWNSYTYKEIKEFWHVEDECSVEDINHILIGIRDDIRYCTAEEVQEGLEKVFKYLEEHSIFIEDGYLEWEDEFEPDYIYAWRYSRLSSYNITHQFLTLDRITNQVIHSKTWVVKDDIIEDGDEIEKCEIVEKDGPYMGNLK